MKKFKKVKSKTEAEEFIELHGDQPYIIESDPLGHIIRVESEKAEAKKWIESKGLVEDA